MVQILWRSEEIYEKVSLPTPDMEDPPSALDALDSFDQTPGAPESEGAAEEPAPEKVRRPSRCDACWMLTPDHLTGSSYSAGESLWTYCWEPKDLKFSRRFQKTITLLNAPKIWCVPCCSQLGTPALHRLTRQSSVSFIRQRMCGR